MNAIDLIRAGAEETVRREPHALAVSGISIDYAAGSRMGEKGEYFQIEAYAPTREALAQVMADHIVTAAKHEPWFYHNSILQHVGGGFVCHGRQYKYDVVGRS